jgi:hypothetical protein
MKSLRLKIIISAIILAITVNVIIIYYTKEYDADYIIVKISGDASMFNGYINSINDKGEIEGITLENELPQEHKIKAQKLYCQIKLIRGENIFIEYWSMGELLEKDTVYSDLYKKVFSANPDNKSKY